MVMTVCEASEDSQQWQLIGFRRIKHANKVTRKNSELITNLHSPQRMNRELRKLGAQEPVLSLSKHGPRVGTRVERAGEGRCEGVEGLRDLTDLRPGCGGKYRNVI